MLHSRPCTLSYSIIKVKVKIILRRRSDGQSVSVSSAIRGLRPHFYYCQTVAGLLMWSALYEERTGLPFTMAAGPRQRSHSWVRVPRDSWPYFTVSDSRLPEPAGTDLQEQGGPVMPPGTGLHFCRLLRLAGLRWRYSNQPPRGVLISTQLSYYSSFWIRCSYDHFARTQQKAQSVLLMKFVDSEGFWRWCVTLRITRFLLSLFITPLLSNGLHIVFTCWSGNDVYRAVA
jgi:hypothetical protein